MLRVLQIGLELLNLSFIKVILSYVVIVPVSSVNVFASMVTSLVSMQY